MKQFQSEISGAWKTFVIHFFLKRILRPGSPPYYDWNIEINISQYCPLGQVYFPVHRSSSIGYRMTSLKKSTLNFVYEKISKIFFLMKLFFGF